MKFSWSIGLTYDLKSDYLEQGLSDEATAEFDKPETIDAIEVSLQRLGHKTERIGNITALVNQLAKGRKWDFVFNIAEGLHGIAREAQIPALLDAYHIPYTFSDPMILALCLNKGLTKRILRDAKISTAPFAIIETLRQLDEIGDCYPLFVKPIAEGSSKGIDSASKIMNDDALFDRVSMLLNTYHQPVLVEKYLPGREFTIGIIGTGPKSRALGALEIILLEDADQEVYSYKNKKYCDKLVKYQLVKDKAASQSINVALQAWRLLGCRDAGRVDIRFDEWNKPCFIEVNPLAGMHPIDSDLPILCQQLNISYTSLIAKIMKSAEKRIWQ